MTTISDESQKSPEQLEREIDTRRSHIVETLDELGNRVSPSHMVDQTVDYVRDNANALSRNISTGVSHNAGPLLLAAAGLAAGGMLWMFNNLRSQGALDDSHDFYGEYDYDVFDEYSDPSALDVDESTGSSAIKDKAHQAQNAAAGAVGQARRKFDSATSNLRQKGRDSQRALRRQSRRVSSGFEQMVDRQPLVVGAVGLAIGALVAASMKSTRTEDRLMGPARNQALERSSEMARQLREEAEEKARRAAEKIQEDIKHAVKTDTAYPH